MEKIGRDTIDASDLFAWRHWHVLRRLGAVSREAEYKARQARLLVDIFKASIANDEARRELFTEKLDVKGARRVLERIGSGEIVIETFFFQAEDGIRDYKVTGVQTCALPIFAARSRGVEEDARHRLLHDRADRRGGRGVSPLVGGRARQPGREAPVRCILGPRGEIGRASCRERV